MMVERGSRFLPNEFLANEDWERDNGWGWWSPNSDIQVIVHPWQFWNWVNMGTTLLLYTAELLGNDSNSGRTALTSHWKVE